jgi:carbon-monoxide dehydrogenase large subunit
VPPPPIDGTIFNQRTQVPLARGKVRHLGEPVAVVVAASRYIAEDALADIAVDYQPLPAVTDLERALMPDSALVHDDVAGNVAASVYQKKGRLRCRPAGRRASAAPPPPLRPRLLGADRDPRRRRRLGRQGRAG